MLIWGGEWVAGGVARVVTQRRSSAKYCVVYKSLFCVVSRWGPLSWQPATLPAAAPVARRCAVSFFSSFRRCRRVALRRAASPCVARFALFAPSKSPRFFSNVTSLNLHQKCSHFHDETIDSRLLEIMSIFHGAFSITL